MNIEKLLKAMTQVCKSSSAIPLKSINTEYISPDSVRLTVTNGHVLASVIVNTRALELACSKMGYKIMQKSIMPLSLIRFFDESPIDYPDWRNICPDNVKCEPVIVTQIDPRELMRLQTIFEAINGTRAPLTFNLYAPSGLYIRSEGDYILLCAPLIVYDRNGEERILLTVTDLDSEDRILNYYKQHRKRG